MAALDADMLNRSVANPGGLARRPGCPHGSLARLLVVGLFGLALLPGRVARADRIDRLVQILRSDQSYKVRLQVAVTLGKLRNRRAVPALIAALNDSNQMVRGIAAAALGQIGDRRAIPDLEYLRKRGKIAFVRGQAKKALDRIARAAPAVSNARIFVSVGKMIDKSSQRSPQLSAALRRALLKEFSTVSGVATDWDGRSRPSDKELRTRRIKVFVLDGAITSFSHERKGADIEVSCEIRVSLSTYPDNSMKAFYTGGAAVAVPASSFRTSAATGLYKDLVEGAAQGAREHIVASYLSHQ